LKTGFDKHILLILAITLHNIPEGLAIGVSFGSITSNKLEIIIPSLVLALGIGLQNIPEGAAVSFPLRGIGFQEVNLLCSVLSQLLLNLYFLLLGALTVTFFSSILPYALSFAAGAMIYVVVEEVIPESQSNGNVDLATLSTMAGFATMMLLDILFSY